MCAARSSPVGELDAVAGPLVTASGKPVPSGAPTGRTVDAQSVPKRLETGRQSHAVFGYSDGPQR
jgi:hypothetical protein